MPSTVRVPRWLAPCVLLVAFVALVVVVRHETPKMTFLYDEWRFIEYRHGNLGGGLFAPYEGNLLALHVVLYRVLFLVVGLKNYLPYQLVALGLHFAVVVLLFRYARTRIGELPALVVSIIFLTLGPAAGQFVTLDGANHTLNMLSLCAMLLYLDRDTPSGDRRAAAALCIGLLSYGYALVFIPAVAVELLIRRQPRRLIPFAVPVGLFAIWYISKGSITVDANLLRQPGADAVAAMSGSPLRLSSIGLVPSYLARLAMFAAGALIGQQEHAGLVVLGAILVGVGLKIRARALSPRVVMLLITLGGSWVIVAFARAAFDPIIAPDAARFIYTGGFMLLLLIVELCRGLQFKSVQQLALVGLLFVVILAGSLPQLRSQSKTFNQIAVDMRGQVAAIDLASGHVPPDAGPGLFGLHVGPVERAYADLGSRPPIDDLTSADAVERAGADRALVAMLGIKLADAASASSEHCTTITATSSGAASTNDTLAYALDFRFPMPSTGLQVRAGTASVRIAVARFADFPGLTLGSVAPGQVTAVTGPGEDGWGASLASTAPFDVCAST